MVGGRVMTNSTGQLSQEAAWFGMKPFIYTVAIEKGYTRLQSWSMNL